MSWLTPLGFLGLIGLIILLIIYLIKPNYQNKFVSSTYVWKLSLKYRKKKLPINKLRNILLIICQILAIVACSAILAQPFIDGEDVDSGKEKVIVIDASANMLSEIEGETRFERAVAEAKKLSDEALEKGGAVSIILAARDASFVVQRLDSESKSTIDVAFADLTADAATKCTYGNGDIDGAMALAEKVLEENAKAEVVLYTGTTYIDDGKVTVKNVTDPSEWNASILEVRAELDENYYRFEVDLASYARSQNVRLYVEINGARGSYGVGDSAENFNGSTLKLTYDALLEMNTPTTVSFGQNEKDNVTDLKIYGYDYVYCYVQEDDSFEIDNSYYLYGGTPLPLRIQYYSTMSNNFVGGILMGLRDRLKDDWEIEIKEIKDSALAVQAGMGKEDEIELTGYDIYIFEHHIPKNLPTDGLVILIDPDQAPKDADFVLGSAVGYSGEKELSAGESHEIMDYVTAEDITVTRYKKITAYDSAYTPIMYMDEDPVVLVKNQPDAKLMIFSFSFHYSNIAVMPQFPIMLHNILDYYIPTTFDSNVYDLYDKVTLNARSTELSIVGPSIDETFTSFPAEVSADAPGLYTVTQTPISGVQIVENFYVTIPDEQCNIVREVDSLTNPYYPPVVDSSDIDLVFYFALALVALLFCEWWLKSRDQ